VTWHLAGLRVWDLGFIKYGWLFYDDVLTTELPNVEVREDDCE
jgi:hypothetical protein